MLPAYHIPQIVGPLSCCEDYGVSPVDIHYQGCICTGLCSKHEGYISVLVKIPSFIHFYVSMSRCSPDSYTKCGHIMSFFSALQCSSSHVSMTTDEKRALLHTLISDPDLKSDVECLVGREGHTIKPPDSLQSSLCSSHRHNSESGVSSRSSGFMSSPEGSLPPLQRTSFDNGQPSSFRPQLDQQSSIEGIVTQLAAWPEVLW